MSVQILEVSTSRSFTQDAKSASGEWSYVVREVGEANPEEAVYNAVLTDAPFFWYSMSRRSIKGDPQGGGIWKVTVPYLIELANAAAQDPTQTPGSGDGPGGGAPSGTPSGPANEDEKIGVNISMEIGGRPPRIIRSLNTYDSRALGGVAPQDFQKAINVQQGGNSEGCDVPDPASTMTFDFTMDSVSWKYIKLLQSLVYKTNDDTWFTYLQHEVAFLGATLKTNQQNRVDVSLRFGIIREYKIEIDDIRTDLPKTSDVSVPGWHYIWIRFRDEKDVSATPPVVTRPYALYVEQILENADFTTIGIGS